MRSLPLIVFALAAALPGLLRSDATIRYSTRMTSAAVTPNTETKVIRMKDTKGMTVEGAISTVIDFAHQQVTVFDSETRSYATMSIADYRNASADMAKSVMPAAGMDILKSAKVTCDPKAPAPSDDIAGIHSVEQDVLCTVTMDMPPGLPAMQGMAMNMSIRTWTPPEEDLRRISGLGQLAEFEQLTNMLVYSGLDSMMPDAFKPMSEAMAKQSPLSLRSVMEMSMNIGGMGATSIMKIETEVAELSSDLIDDSVFAVPSGYKAASYADIQNASMQARMQAVKSPAPEAQAKPDPPPGDIKAYVPSLMPVTQTDPERPQGAAGTSAMVMLLVTIDAQGKVIASEPLGGPEALRKPAMDAVAKWTYRPVLREGTPVTAYTDADVFFLGSSSSGLPEITFSTAPEGPDEVSETRLSKLRKTFPRTPEQVFADAEQDASGRDAEERFSMLPELTLQALHIDAYDKAKLLADELSKALPQHVAQPDYGEAFYDAHMALGLLALHDNDVETAKQELLESGLTTGSPILNSFGPNMWLANELLKKDGSAAVLEFLNKCRTFWPSGGPQLDAWADAIHKGATPIFGPSLR